MVPYTGPVVDLGVKECASFAGFSQMFHNTLIESLACGTPVIASRMGAFPEIINHGQTGFLCSNKAQYFEAIDNVGGLKREAARADAETRWHYTRAAADYLKLLEG